MYMDYGNCGNNGAPINQPAPQPVNYGQTNMDQQARQYGYPQYNPQQFQGNQANQPAPQPAPAPQPVQQPIPQQNTYQDLLLGMSWVSNISEVHQRALPPNSVAVFFDSEVEGRYYIKTSDGTGRPSVRAFDSTDITNKLTPNGVDLTRFVTRDELIDLIKSVSSGGGNVNAIGNVQASQPVQQAAQPVQQPVQSVGLQQPVEQIQQPTQPVFPGY